MVNAQTGGTVTPQQQSSGQQSDRFLRALGRCLWYWATVKAFKTGTVSGYQRVISVLFWVCVLHLGSIVLLTIPQLRDPWPWERALIFFAVNVWGVFYCYRRSGGEDCSTMFIERLVCLSMPLVILVVPAVLIIYAVCFTLSAAWYGSPVEPWHSLDLLETTFHDIIYGVVEVIFYLLLACTLKHISRSRSTGQKPQQCVP